MELSIRRESPPLEECEARIRRVSPPFGRVWGKDQKREPPLEERGARIRRVSPRLEECGARPVSAGGEVEVWWWRRNLEAQGIW